MKPTSVVQCLEQFRVLVKLQSNCKSIHEPWPPKHNRTIKFKSPFSRSILVFNRRLLNGTFEPTLAFTGKANEPRLMLNEAEFQSLIKHLDWIKQQLESYFKLL
ncbi:hypothetical protein BdWA1_001798 [Babesia duncani]|uniref:Uncharacterized protein n=1 Tax=Babesia duncani TaxID=323732 RepID=A0AAD9PL39_9APIC|nr:hypothetical protein BdWA1_001798 [Babesia duncani]